MTTATGLKPEGVAPATDDRPQVVSPDHSTQPHPRLTKPELDRLLTRWSQDGMPVAREKSVVDFIREHTQARPKAIAVQDGDDAMDYATLDRLSNRVANRLL